MKLKVSKPFNFSRNVSWKNYAQSTVYLQFVKNIKKRVDNIFYVVSFMPQSPMLALLFPAIEELAVADFLKWLTGSCNYPPLGFPKKIRCQFLHGCPGSCKCRPTTSTCDLVLTLPVHLNTEEEIGCIMTSALTDRFGFTLL